MTETDLILRARGGDAEAWEALTRLHQESVFRFAYLLLGDPDNAEDTAQETFVRAYYALKRFEVGRRLRPWLLSITSRLASNQRRSLGRYFAALSRLAREAPPEEAASDPEDEAQEVRQVVRRLKPAFQEVIYLRYFLDMSEAETASTLGVAAGTVKSRVHRALASLRELMAREVPSLTDSLRE